MTRSSRRCHRYLSLDDPLVSQTRRIRQASQRSSRLKGEIPRQIRILPGLRPLARLPCHAFSRLSTPRVKASKPLTFQTTSMSRIPSPHGIAEHSCIPLAKGSKQDCRRPRTVQRWSNVLASCPVAAKIPITAGIRGITGFETPACRPKGFKLGSKSLSAPKIGSSPTRTKADRLEFNHSPHSPCAAIAILTEANGRVWTFPTEQIRDLRRKAKLVIRQVAAQTWPRCLLINKDGRYGQLCPPKRLRYQGLSGPGHCSDVASGAGTLCRIPRVWGQ